MAPERWRQVEELYHAALMRDERDRKAFLANACAGDEVLQREVESLLAQPASVRGFLDGPAMAVAAHMVSDIAAPLLSDRDIGTYRVQTRIGAGGMGEVYRAFDTKLNRPVAIKFLSDEFADTTRRRRFQREAQMASSLNHPHILTVHDIGELDGRQYLVTELVDGGTLKDWASADRRTWPQIVELLVGVADGLATAHTAGIVHRDVKPENILVATNGYAKLADFGLAKLFESSVQATTGTATAARTLPGLIVGTVAYMSPEQASGQPVDARSDIFSFGIVLYELFAGRRPFEGETDLERLQAVVHRPTPPLGDRCPDLPLALRMAVEKALEKDPADRYQTMREMVVDLRRVTRQQIAPLAERRPLVLYASLGAAVLLGLAVGAAFFLSRNASAPPTRPLDMQQITAFSDFATQPSLSPDGRMLAFIRGPGSFTTTGQIYVKLLPDGEPVQLTHDTTLKMMPAFSPDGTRVVYTVRTRNNSWDTWIVPVLGGEARLWLPNASGLRWTRPQRLLFSEIKTGIHMALVSATESRTESRDVYIPQSIRGMAHRSYLSPDETRVLVTEMDSGGMIPCRMVPFDGSSASQTVGPATGKCTHAAWSPDGRWIYVTSDASGSFQIWRQRFPDGKPEQLTFGPTEAEGLAVSPDGRSLLTSIGLAQDSVWVSENGNERQVSTEGRAILPAWGDGFPTSIFSPDGRKLYYLVRTGVSRGFDGGELWVADLTSGSSERLLPGLFITTYDISADGEQVVFAATSAEGKSRIWLARVDRRSAPTVLPPAEALGPVFGRDGEVYFRGPEGNLWYVYALTLNSGQIRKFTSEQAVNSPTISPDGRWILSWIPAAGKNTSTVLKAFSRENGPPITICSSCYLKWTRDQRHLFFSFTPGNAGNGDGVGTTIVVALPAGRALPDLPPGGIESETQLRKLPNIQIVDRTGLFPGPTSSVYAFQRQLVQRNLYRMTIPQ
jgi:eukaryotic-like serine/threonine-protein kinase